jgi:hypothetical protein
MSFLNTHTPRLNGGVWHNATSDKTKTVRNMVAAKEEKNIEKSFQAKFLLENLKPVSRD